MCFSAGSHPGFNRNAWIGGVVGAFFGGLFLGFFAAVIILWRQRRKEGLELELAGRKSSDSCHLVASRTRRRSGPDNFDLDHFLALPASNKSLVNELGSLGHLIQLHVEDNYHTSPVTQHPGSLSEALSDLGLVTTQQGVPGPAQLASMALQPETRQSSLQHIIARAIFGSMSVDSVRDSLTKLSLLPASATSMIKSMAPCEQHLGNRTAESVALTRWRQLSAFLLNQRRSDRGSLLPEEEPLKPQAQDIVTALNKALGVFVTKEDLAHQEEHLLQVVLECAKLGYIIFSQPAEYAYDFASTDENRVVVCPGLRKTSDEHGLSCEPETVAAPEKQMIDSAPLSEV